MDKHSTEVGSSPPVLDTLPWITGRQVVIRGEAATAVDLAQGTVFVCWTREQIKKAIEFVPGQDDAGELARS